MKNQILLTFMLAAATPPQAADWHVAPDGDDNNAGTEAAPFATIQHAINQAAAGDRVFLAEGEYSQAVKINKPNLTLRALPGAHAHIHQPIDDEDVEATVWIQPDGAGTHLFGLEISGGYNYTLKIDSIWADDGVTLPPEEREAATGVVVEKSRLRGSGRDVIKLTPGTDGTALLHNEIFDSGQRFAGNAECVDNVNSSEMLMIGNHLHDCATNGVYAKGGARNVRIERNLVRDTGAAGIVLGYDDTDVEWFSPETNPEYFENLQGSVTNNFVMNTAHAGIALWGALDPTVAHNTLVGVATSAQEGIFMWRGGPCVPEGDSCTYRRNPVTNAVIVNNLVLMGAGERGALGSREEGVAEDTLINHNHYQDGEGNLSFRWLGAKKNTFAAWQADTGMDQQSGAGLVDLDGHHHLLPTSSNLIDQGTSPFPAQADYDGHARSDGRPDIGADELSSAPALAIPPVEGAAGTGFAGKFPWIGENPGDDDDDDDDDDGGNGNGDDDGDGGTKRRSGGGVTGLGLLTALLLAGRRRAARMIAEPPSS